MLALTVVALLGCGAPPAARPNSLSNTPPARAPATAPAPVVYVDRGLTIGLAEHTPIRGEWRLTIDGDRATLVVSAERAVGPVAMAQAESAAWNAVPGWLHTERGPVRREPDHLALELASSSDSLYLNCYPRAVQVAAPRALRVPTPGHAGDCQDRGVWEPATTTRVDALICTQADGFDDGQSAGIDGTLGALDETLFRFVASPGIELVQVNDGCFQSSGLRLVAPE